MSLDTDRSRVDDEDVPEPTRLREALSTATEFGNDLRLRIANIRKLHPKSPYNSLICQTCFEPYPCGTVRACNGENF